MEKETFYITTAIDYPSSSPHLGHAYEKICADVIARWEGLKGKSVFFLTGTDEHGQKIQRKAAAAGKSPQEFVDEMHLQFKKLCEKLNISHDAFIRTTDETHVKVAEEIFRKVLEKGDIYKGIYEGLYCVECESFYLEKDLAGGNCPVHKKPAETLKEESYFFRMAKYSGRLMKHIESHPEFIQPAGKGIEILNRMKEGVKDLSVSRAGFDWGIPLPNDPKHVQFVWFDALLNYLSGLGYPGKKFEKYWPGVQLIGKDIVWHHTVIFGSILLSAGIPLPKTVLVHGFVNLKGEKMSKSSGTVVDPVELSERFGEDALRYFLIKEIPFGQDGDFSEDALKGRLNNELANDLGNLVSRVLALIEKNCGGKLPEGKVDKELEKALDLKKLEEHMEKFELHHALTEAMGFVLSCNKFINEKKVWELKGKELEDALYSLADALRIISVLMHPFIPRTSEKIAEQLGTKAGSLNEAKFGLINPGTKVKKGEVLFKKI